MAKIKSSDLDLTYDNQWGHYKVSLDRDGLKHHRELIKELTRDAVRAGLGIARMPAFFVERDLAKGTLSRVLPQHELPKSFATVLYPRSIVPSPARRCLIEALSDRSEY
jgi:DNA-binding transcriptional LysR family regulator